MADGRLVEVIDAAGEAYRPELARPPAPADPGDYLRWWIDDDHPATGTGMNNLADVAHQVRTYWEGRLRPNVHLFHYADLQADLDGEMRRVAAALGIPVDEASWPDYRRAASLDAMRGRAAQLVPEAQHDGMWTSVEGFFKAGGRRNWADLLSAADLAHYEQRLAELAGPEAAAWANG
jgi:hypothetical protein